MNYIDTTFKKLLVLPFFATSIGRIVPLNHERRTS